MIRILAFQNEPPNAFGPGGTSAETVVPLRTALSAPFVGLPFFPRIPSGGGQTTPGLTQLCRGSGWTSPSTADLKPTRAPRPKGAGVSDALVSSRPTPSCGEAGCQGSGCVVAEHQAEVLG